MLEAHGCCSALCTELKLGFSFAGNGITLEGAVPSEQDSQPKPAKRARTSFTAEQLQVVGLGWGREGLRCQLQADSSPCHPPGHAGTVCSGQQPRCTNSSETRRHDGAESESHSGEGWLWASMQDVVHGMQAWDTGGCGVWDAGYGMQVWDTGCGMKAKYGHHAVFFYQRHV